MCARVSSTRSSVLVVLLGNAQQYYLFGWGEVIIHLKLEKVAPSTFFFLSIWRVDLPPAAYSDEGESNAARSLSPHLPQSFRSTRRALQDIYFFSSSFSGGDACSNTFRVPFLFALCVCGYQIIGVADSSPRRTTGFGCSQFFSDSTDAIDPLCHRVFPPTHMDRDKKK
jgi:hypothetical protein